MKYVKNIVYNKDAFWKIIEKAIIINYRNVVMSIFLKYYSRLTLDTIVISSIMYDFNRNFLLS